MKEDKANELLDNVVDVSNPPPSPTFLQGMDEAAQPTSLISTGSGQVGGGLPQVIEGPGDSGDVYPQGNDPPPLEYSQTGARPTQGVIWNWCRPQLCILYMIFHACKPRDHIFNATSTTCSTTTIQAAQITGTFSGHSFKVLPQTSE